MFLIWVLVEIAELHGPTSLAYLTITAFRFRLSLLRKINVWHLRNNTPVTLCSPYICTHKCMYTYTHICIYTHALHYTISLSKSLCVSYLMARGKKIRIWEMYFCLDFWDILFTIRPTNLSLPTTKDPMWMTHLRKSLGFLVSCDIHLPGVWWNKNCRLSC